MNPRIENLRSALATRAAARRARRHLARELADYRTQAERDELRAILARHSEEDAREVEAILARQDWKPTVAGIR